MDSQEALVAYGKAVEATAKRITAEQKETPGVLAKAIAGSLTKPAVAVLLDERGESTGFGFPVPARSVIPDGCAVGTAEDLARTVDGMAKAEPVKEAPVIG